MLAALLLNLGGSPPPPLGPAPRGGAPLWWRTPWTEEDEDELQDAQDECAELLDIVETPIVYTPTPPAHAKEQARRLANALERIRIVQDRIQVLQRQKEDAQDYEDFIALIRALGSDHG